MAPTPPPRWLGQVPALDGLRGIAVLLVVVSHLNLLIPRLDITGFQPLDGLIEGGYLGVDIFFVLSGFLITAILLREERGTGGVRFGNFYARRALRLLPALYFMLLCHAFYTVVTDLAWSVEAESIQAAVLYYSNWLVVYDLGAIATGTNHLWSLAVEEQFYLVWPAVLVGLLGLRRRTAAAAVGIAVAIVVIAVHRARLWDQGTTWLELFVRTDTRADSLLVGALLATLWVRRSTPTRGVDAAAWLAAGAALVYLGLVEASSPVPYLWGGSTVFAVLVAIVLLAILNGTWGPSRVLAHRSLRAVGRVSYGLYLWHFPVFHVVARYGSDWPEPVRVLVAVPAAVGATLVSWWFLEKPLQSFRVRFPPAAPRAAVPAASN